MTRREDGLANRRGEPVVEEVRLGPDPAQGGDIDLRLAPHVPRDEAPRRVGQVESEEAVESPDPAPRWRCPTPADPRTRDSSRSRSKAA